MQHACTGPVKVEREAVQHAQTAVIIEVHVRKGAGMHSMIYLAAAAAAAAGHICADSTQGEAETRFTNRSTQYPKSIPAVQGT